jgi:glycosyltransferase involved in cell wall biosynthesis
MNPTVALVCEPPDGGAAENVRQLALGLGDHGYRPFVIAPADFAPTVELVAAGVEVRTIPFRRDYRHPHDDVAAALAVRRAVAHGVALVHAHSAKAGVLARVAARVAGVPLIYTPHLFPFAGHVSPVRRRFGLATERLLAPWSATTICVCRAEWDEALRARVGRPDRLALVYNGATERRGHTPNPVLVRMRAGGPVVGAVSALRPAKGLDVLLHATPGVLAAFPDARVVIVGNGSERPRLEALARRLGLIGDPRFALLPFAPPAADHLAELDVFVLPSRAESFPIAVLEAMACGLAVIASAIGGIPEAVSPRTGRLVPPDDPAALAAAVIELLHDPELRAALGAAARAEHGSRFTVERMVAETAAVYDAVRANHAPARRASAG